MPGQLCNGLPKTLPLIQESRAFCEGRKAQADGELKATNPHDPNGNPVAYDSWDNGWDSGFNGDPRGCCSE